MGPNQIETPAVIVLAEGETQKDSDQARGHIFEIFIAKLLTLYGYATPTRANLNVTSAGIELDISTHHNLTNDRLIAECKAYSTNVRTKELTNFIGKVTTERYDEPGTVGLFVAFPGLVAQGEEKLAQVMKHDPKFLAFRANDVVKKLVDHKVLYRPDTPTSELAEFAIIITKDGTFSAAKALDDSTGRPIGIRVWSMGEAIPSSTLSLIAASSYASGLPLLKDERQGSPVSSDLTIVRVRGSSEDFEYQFPASPKFFVGRKVALKQFDELIRRDPRSGSIVVLNGQSGWGKSSLALKLASTVESAGGSASVFDTRTATSPRFVWAALQEAITSAKARGIVEPPSDGSYAGLRSCLETLNRSSWKIQNATLFIFFDQFENVFRDPELTREFRDLAFSVREVKLPLIVGFAWKTDLVTLSESHPHLLRDEIRAEATVINLRQLGPDEIDVLLQRLRKSAGRKVLKDVTRRLREYSQGLPWLFKKLASHLLSEMKSGLSQDDLLAESLNVRKLFESDLAGLQPDEVGALHKIARLAPLPFADAAELIPKEIIQSLIFKRLLVTLGEYIDTYWDIFRDYLSSGDVPIQETYILRETPSRAIKLLRVVVANGGQISVEDAAVELGTTVGVVLNLQQTLRQTNVLLRSPGIVAIPEDLGRSSDLMEAVSAKLSTALKRNRAFIMLSKAIERQGGSETVARFADLLPEAFPAVSGEPKTWRTYSRSFVKWFQFAGLVTVKRGVVTMGGKRGSIDFWGAAREALRGRRATVFPQSAPRPTLMIARYLAGFGESPKLSGKSIAKSLHDLHALGIVILNESGNVAAQAELFDGNGDLQPQQLLAQLRKLPGGSEAIDALLKSPRLHRLEVGAFLERGYETNWSNNTRKNAGTYFRAWASLAGIAVVRTAASSPPAGGGPLFD